IPNLGSEHLYKAGNWLAETNLAERADLKLEGINPAPKGTIQGFSTKQNTVFDNVAVSSNAKECHCIHATLRLPYPSSPIRSLRRVKIPVDVLGGDRKKSLVDNGIFEVESASVQILTYGFRDDNCLQLGDHPWE